MEWGFDQLFALLAVVLVVEGILPAISPDLWRKFLLNLVNYNDYVVRGIGLLLMVTGAVLLALVHNWDTLTDFTALGNLFD